MIQNENASIRGNAIRLDPIISGTSQLPSGPTITELIIIIIVPCSLTIAMYVAG